MLQNPRLLLAASISIAVHGAFAAALLTQQEEAQLLESSSPFEMVVLAEQRVDLAMPSEGLGGNPQPEPEPEPETSSESMEDEPVEEIEEESNLPEGESAPASAAEAYVDAVYESSQLNNRRPKYPLKARRKGMEGVVTLQVEVSVLGEPSEISILNSSGYRLLDREARRTVSRWRFHPATQGGQPVTSLVEVPIRFQLKG